MILFRHKGHTFEDHGPNCECDSCQLTQWHGENRAVVFMPTRENGYYQVWRPGGVYKTREEAADRLLRRWQT